jgi:hypothetical protein
MGPSRSQDERRLVAQLTLAEQHGLLSREHCTVDGTLLEAWASHKPCQLKDGPPDASDGDADHARETVRSTAGSERAQAAP